MRDPNVMALLQDVRTPAYPWKGLFRFHLMYSFSVVTFK